MAYVAHQTITHRYELLAIGQWKKINPSNRSSACRDLRMQLPFRWHLRQDICQEPSRQDSHVIELGPSAYRANLAVLCKVLERSCE